MGGLWISRFFPRKEALRPPRLGAPYPRIMPPDSYGTMTEDYVKLLWKTHEWTGEGPTTNEIAAALGVAASSVSGNLKKLARDGLIDYEPYGRASLSTAGRELAQKMVRRHRLIETLLVERYAYSWDEVHDEAEVLEHAVSDRLLDLIDAELGFPDHDPHGDPIPREGVDSTAPPRQRLPDLAAGVTARVTRVSDHDSDLLRYLGTLSIRVGTRIRLEGRHDFAGSLTVRRLAGADDAEVEAESRDEGVLLEIALVAANAIQVHPESAPTPAQC